MSIFTASRSSRSGPKGVLLATGLAVATLLCPQIGIAQSEGPFAKFIGSWRGSGQVVTANGARERIACRATYSVEANGASLSQTLVCASDSYRVVFSSYIVADGHSVHGYWQETTRQASGSITGQVVDGEFEGSVAGSGFTAGILLRTNGRRQQVTISPQGGDVTSADIILSRQS